MSDAFDVWRGALSIMVLKTSEVMGGPHGYGIARRIEQTSGGLLAINYGTLYPALLKSGQGGFVASKWGLGENNRRAKYYKLKRAGRKKLEKDAPEWGQTTFVLARFLSPGEKLS